MLTFDRYLIRQFLNAFLVFLVAFIGLFIIMDAFANVTEFITYGKKTGSLIGVLSEYYGARSLVLFDRLSSVLALIAALFTLTALQGRNELTAMMAAGISKRRVVLPIIGAVACVALLAAINRELVIPHFQDRLSRNAQNWMGDSAQRLRPRYDNQTDILLGGKSTYADGRRIESPTFQLPPRFATLGTRVSGANAYYQDPTEERPGGYLLKGVTHPVDLENQKSQFLDEQKIIFCPSDTPWLKPNECFVASDLSFEELAVGQGWRQFSSSVSLIRGLHNRSLGLGADVRVTIHARFVQPFLDITLLFLGLPLVLTRDNRNLYVAIGTCLLLVTGFIGLVLICHSMGTNYLINPVLAAWCPLAIFVPIAVYLYDPLRE